MKRASLLLGAAISVATAALLVLNTGLPERAVYSGQLPPGERPFAPELDALAPPFVQPILDGAPIDLFQLRGSPVIVNFWATWCAPCRVEMPALQAVYERHRDEGLRVLAVNLGEPEETVRSWVEDMELTFDVVLDARQQVAALYQLRGVPSTYVVAPDGVIAQVFYGPTTEDQLERGIAPYLSATS